MRCPNCSKENQPTNQFCIFCGARLNAGVPPPPIEAETVTRPPQSIEEEVRQLRDSIRQINLRLAAVEQRQGMPQAPAIPVQATPSAPAIPITAPPQVEHWVAPPVVQKPTPQPKPPRPPREWEQILGGNWLARIGVLALLFGIGFFLKFAFDKNWIVPVVRVLIGGVAGLLMLGGGYLWRKRYPILMQVLTGGGIGMLYLSIFASFTAYDLVGFIPAVILIVVVCAASAVMALRYNSMGLAILGIIGAFIAPFFLGAFHSGRASIVGGGPGYEILGYILVIDIGVLVVSTFRNWRWFTLLALVFSLVVWGVWYSAFEWEATFAGAEIFLTLIFLVFVGATTLFHIIWRRVSQPFDYALMVINAAAYSGISMGLFWGNLRAWTGGFIFLLALFYGGLAYVTRKRTEDNRLSLFALGIAIVLFTTAIPVLFGNVAWTTVTWAAQASVLIWLSLVTKNKFFRVSGYVAFGLVAIRLLFFDSWIYSGPGIGAYRPVFNDRMLAFMVGIIALYAASYLVRRYKDERWEVEHTILFVAGNIFTLWLIGTEVADYSGIIRPTVGANLSLLFLYAIAAVTILNQLVWKRQPQMTSDFVLLFIDAVAFSAFAAVTWNHLQAWMGLTYLALSCCYATLAFSYVRKQAGRTSFANCVMGIAIVLFTAAAPIQFGEQPWGAVIWSVEAAALMWLALRTNLEMLRWASYVVFFITAFRLLIIDTAITVADFTPVLNHRFLAYAVGIAGMYTAGYLISRGRSLLRENETKIAAPAFFIAANFFTLWLLTAEVLNTFDKALYNLNAYESFSGRGVALRNFQNLSITGLWAIYAVVALVVGIFRRIRFLRLGALVLLLIAIGKVFVYDVFNLAMVYRIVAFIGLGLLLIAAGYLYQRYKQRIVTFLKE